MEKFFYAELHSAIINVVIIESAMTRLKIIYHLFPLPLLKLVTLISRSGGVWISNGV
jgi:hypothetical protein